MAEPQTASGYFPNRLPYNRFGRGPRPLVILDGLSFEHKPLSGSMARFFTSGYRFLEADYTAYLVSRKPGLPEDPFYTPAQFRETAAGIPKARLIIYPKMGHPASGKEFSRDVLEFLREGWIEAAQTTSESRQR